jgi:hypothetical protein
MDTYTSMQEIGNLLHEAAEIHHRVFRIVDGADDDWASWYADWLINLSELPTLLKVKPVRSELVYLLVGLDKQYTADSPPSLGSLTTHPGFSTTSGQPPADNDTKDMVAIGQGTVPAPRWCPRLSDLGKWRSRSTITSVTALVANSWISPPSRPW